VTARLAYVVVLLASVAWFALREVRKPGWTLGMAAEDQV